MAVNVADEDGAGIFVALKSAVVCDLPEVGDPLVNDLTAPGLDHVHDVAQGMPGDSGVVMAEITPSGLGDPYLCGAGAGGAQADVDMDGLQRIIFIGPEVNPVGADLKNLRHCRSLPPGQSARSGGRWSAPRLEAAPDRWRRSPPRPPRCNREASRRRGESSPSGRAVPCRP